MAQEKPNPLMEWLEALRAHWPALVRHARSSAREVRAEPSVLWSSAYVRVAIFAVAGLALLLVALQVRSCVLPARVEQAAPARKAHFHVVCTNASCRHQFHITAEFDFDDFPVRCPKCGNQTGHEALRCYSDTCQGRWVTPVREGGHDRCPDCGTILR